MVEPKATRTLFGRDRHKQNKNIGDSQIGK